jgi:hypothetical protein
VSNLVSYPESVSSDYLEYQRWDSLQVFYFQYRILTLKALSSSVTGLLATQAILQGGNLFL